MSVNSTITDPLGHDTTFGYDSLGRKTSVKDHQNNETKYEYNKVDSLTKVTLPDLDGSGSLTSPVT